MFQLHEIVQFAALSFHPPFIHNHLFLSNKKIHEGLRDATEVSQLHYHVLLNISSMHYYSYIYFHSWWNCCCCLFCIKTWNGNAKNVWIVTWNMQMSKQSPYTWLLHLFISSYLHFMYPANLYGYCHFWYSLMCQHILLWHLSSICGVKTMPCHFVFYYSLRAVIRCSQVRTMRGPWLWQSRCPSAWECFIEDFMHYHCEMSWSTMLQKPHLFSASFVAQVSYSVIPPLFRMCNTIDSFIKEEIWANNMTGSYISSYCHVVGGLPMSVIC